MASYRRFRRMSLAAGVAGLLAGCAGVMVGQPTPVTGRGPLNVPQPTATQIGVGANPTPSAPRMNTVVAQVKPRNERAGANPYGWLEDVHSAKARRWISKENQASTNELAKIPQRAWIRSELERPTGTSNDVVVESIYYLSADGARLPIEIAHQRDLARDGNRPALLTVYSASSKPPGRLLDEPLAVVWLRMGGIYARAQVRDALASVPTSRGAGGTVADRSVAISDLFAAAQSVIDSHYTRRARLGIYGRGFGGLMAGAAVILRPDFFGAALPTGTWAQYRQIANGNCFPPTLVTTAEHGGNSRPWDAYELAAALQAAQICGHPILLRVGSEEGTEGGLASGRERAADELAFAAKWLGAQPPR